MPMTSFAFDISLSLLVLCSFWVLLFNLKRLSLYLYDTHKAIWEEVTFKHWFFVKRENYQIIPFNHKIFKLLFLKTNIEDNHFKSLQSVIKINLFVCVLLFLILLFTVGA